MIDAHVAAPERREAQRVLAREITGLVHGPAALAAAEEATAIVFGASDEPSEAALESLVDEIPTARLAPLVVRTRGYPSSICWSRPASSPRRVKPGDFWARAGRRWAGRVPIRRGLSTRPTSASAGSSWSAKGSVRCTSSSQNNFPMEVDALGQDG